MDIRRVRVHDTPAARRRLSCAGLARAARLPPWRGSAGAPAAATRLRAARAEGGTCGAVADLPRWAAIEDGQLAAQLLHPPPVAACMHWQRAAWRLGGPGIAPCSSTGQGRPKLGGMPGRQACCAGVCNEPPAEAGTRRHPPGRKVWAPSISFGSSWSQCRSDRLSTWQLLANCGHAWADRAEVGAAVEEGAVHLVAGLRGSGRAGQHSGCGACGRAGPLISSPCMHRVWRSRGLEPQEHALCRPGGMPPRQPNQPPDWQCASQTVSSHSQLPLGRRRPPRPAALPSAHPTAPAARRLHKRQGREGRRASSL